MFVELCRLWRVCTRISLQRSTHRLSSAQQTSTSIIQNVFKMSYVEALGIDEYVLGLYLRLRRALPLPNVGLQNY